MRAARPLERQAWRLVSGDLAVRTPCWRGELSSQVREGSPYQRSPPGGLDARARGAIVGGWEHTVAFEQRGKGMLWIVLVAMILIIAVLGYCVAMSSEQVPWSRTRRALMGRDRTTERS